AGISTRLRPEKSRPKWTVRKLMPLPEKLVATMDPLARYPTKGTEKFGAAVLNAARSTAWREKTLPFRLLKTRESPAPACTYAVPLSGIRGEPPPCRVKPSELGKPLK